jgi:hypothetical protein
VDASPLEAYRASAEQLVQRLREQVHLTAERRGRQREFDEYFASAEALQQSLNALAEAEFDWCGSFVVRTYQSFVEEEDAADGPDGDPAFEEAPVVSVVGRWDYLVTDATALLDHGRTAYSQAWPDDTSDDAEIRVQDVGSAVRAIMHGAELPDLDAAPGLQPLLSAVELVRHAGTSGDDFFKDPFSLLRE